MWLLLFAGIVEMLSSQIYIHDIIIGIEYAGIPVKRINLIHIGTRICSMDMSGLYTPS